MLLLLVRHAHAGDRDPSQWPDDTQRPLTDKGRKAHAKVARALRNLELAPELVLTSPWLRAMQTAEIMRDVMLLPQPPVPTTALADDPDLARIAAEVGPARRAVGRGARGAFALAGGAGRAAAHRQRPGTEDGFPEERGPGARRRPAGARIGDALVLPAPEDALGEQIGLLGMRLHPAAHVPARRHHPQSPLPRMRQRRRDQPSRHPPPALPGGTQVL